MSSLTEVRCPYCLYKRKIPSTRTTKVSCTRCARKFDISTALPVANDDLSHIALKTASIGPVTIILFTIISGFSGIYAYKLEVETSGLNFISGYIPLAILCLLISRIDLRGLKTLIFIYFEAIGIIRFITTFNSGMSNYVFLLITMVVGGLFILSDSWIDRFRNGGSGCGGGCGGSGCGGGCGGCGG